jgi:hypothetical protein
MRLNRHCEPTGPREARPDDRLREAIHRAAWTEWIASTFALRASADTSSLSLLAMTAKSVIEPEIIML